MARGNCAESAQGELLMFHRFVWDESMLKERKWDRLSNLARSKMLCGLFAVGNRKLGCVVLRYRGI